MQKTLCGHSIFDRARRVQSFDHNDELKSFGQLVLAACKNLLMEGAAVRVHCHDAGKILDLEFPNGLRRTELLQKVNIANRFYTFYQHLHGPANGMEVNTAVLFASFESLIAHPAFADDATESKIANDLPLVRLFSNRRGRSGGHDFPTSLFVFHDYWSTMINNAIAQIHPGW